MPHIRISATFATFVAITVVRFASNFWPLTARVSQCPLRSEGDRSAALPRSVANGMDRRRGPAPNHTHSRFGASKEHEEQIHLPQESRRSRLLVSSPATSDDDLCRNSDSSGNRPGLNQIGPSNRRHGLGALDVLAW